jgi:hypothetical protein
LQTQSLLEIGNLPDDLPFNLAFIDDGLPKKYENFEKRHLLRKKEAVK